MKIWNKILCVVLVLLLSQQAVFAAPVGPPGAGGVAPELSHLKYALNHDENFSMLGGYLELLGSGLQGIDVYFELGGQGFVQAGNRVTDTSSFVKINLSVADAGQFTGRVRVGTLSLDLRTANFPNIQGSDRQTIVKGQGQSIRFTGNYLNHLNRGEVAGTYGAGTQSATLGTSADPLSLVLTDPVNPGRLGYQNIVFRRETPATASLPAVEVEYLYRDAFRIIEDLAAGDIEMYPNTGSKGDEVYFRSDTFSDTRSYVVYFLKSLTDRPSAVNRAATVDLSLNIAGTEDRLTVRVPEQAGFEPQTYYVLVTDVQNGQVVAEQLVKRQDGSGEYDQFVVIQADNRPRIESVYPVKGPDTGSEVEIKANYVLSLKIPDLIANSAFLNPPVGQDADRTLVLEYPNGTYKGEAVRIVRRLTVAIGEKAAFIKNASGQFQLQQATPDQIMVRTQPVSDAETDPFKDVIIEMETELTVSGGINAGKKYVFRQVVVKRRGYEFEPSTYTPVIDGVTPPLIQIEDTASGYATMHDETLISIKGGRFLVDRFVAPDGSVITRMPTVLVKKNDNNTFNTRYQLGFFPNREIVHGGVTYRGLIYYKESEDSGVEHLLRDGSGRPVPLDMVVLGAQGAEVDGVSGNQIGTEILIRIPASALIRDGGIKHIQVTNPTRKSAEYGRSAILSDVVEMVRTADVPVIEHVIPNIVTIEGGDEIRVTGANIAAGVRLFLDGDEITSFTRELDPSGNRIIVKFKAPKGREGTTQLLLQNPSGGSASADFTYVRSFNRNPVFDRFTPPSGTEGTYVLIDGDNFLKPDPTAAGERGVDAFRLIGSRVLIDGRDVNTYKTDPSGRIVFGAYTAPAAAAAIRTEAGKAVFSPSARNASVTAVVGGNTVTASIAVDSEGNPALRLPNAEYSIRAAGGGYTAYADGAPAGNASVQFAPIGAGTGRTTVAIAGGPTFRIDTDMKLMRLGVNLEGERVVTLADYADSVTLKSASGERFTLSMNFRNEPVLTNGRDKTYILKPNAAGTAAVAVDSLGNERPVSATPDGIDLDGTALGMATPYEVDAASGVITGNLAKVLSRTQILFRVPALTTGRGFKDLVVVNPDTKSASKTGNAGFYYISQATSKPVIRRVDPPKGSVDGGYYVTIEGGDFEDDMRVFIDGTEVPAADTHVALDGSSVVIRMPKSTKKLDTDFGVDALAVPVVVLNPDGGSAGVPDGFTYIIPMSTPTITRILPTSGSSNGGEIVEITGYEFRYYEPYTNLVGGAGYDPGDRFVDLYKNGKWDDLIGTHEAGALERVPLASNAYYSVYYRSAILPKVYFGETEARIVEFARGYLKVIAPPHPAGTVQVYVINNDSGVSNKLPYTYQSTAPEIRSVIPDIGRRGGQEPKEIFGSKLYASSIRGYAADDADTIRQVPDVGAIVRFGAIDNNKIARNEPNSGLINNQRATIRLEGGLEVAYRGDLGELELVMTEHNLVYRRTFRYDNSEVYVPVGMLRLAGGGYYVPGGLRFDASGNPVTSTPGYEAPYEYVRIRVEDRRVFVERGYAPRVIYKSEHNVTVYTPSYHTIGSVPMAYVNPDGGVTSRNFTYTNPASVPKIYRIEPQTLAHDQTKWLVESSVDGGVDIEIIGRDLRPGVKVTIGTKPATLKEVSTRTINGVEYDLVVATVPKGDPSEIDVPLPIILQNEDRGLATSNHLQDLIGPNHGGATIPYYFVYKKPLSFPRIDRVEPSRTSIAGGNKIVITGSDFRPGGYIVIGTRAGIPIYSGVISEQGTKYTFVTPTDMSLGPKDIQVLNNDYGTAVAKNALTVVSAPTVEPGVYDADGSPIRRIHVTGGQRIMLRGTGFQSGAKVYFGGVWMEVPRGAAGSGSGSGTGTGPGSGGAGAASPIPEADRGLYRNDKIYYVKDGVPAASVEFVDDKTLIVTTPTVVREGEFSIVVRNPDWGISDDSAKLEYRVPIPSDPLSLKATVVNNRYIKLYDYTASEAKYFEIYAYIGAKSNAALLTAGMTDFRYLGITETEPYKIIELPGYDKMTAMDRIVFAVKAVNKFGQSGWSNLAEIPYAQMKDVRELGPEDLDGSIGVPLGQDYTVETERGTIQVTFGSVLSGSNLYLDLTPIMRIQTDQRRLLLPEELVRSSNASITVNSGLSLIRFAPVALNTPEFRRIDAYHDAYATVTETVGGQTPSPSVRGYKQASPVCTLRFHASSNEESAEFRTLSGRPDYTIAMNAGLTAAQKQGVRLYRYDEQTGSYREIPSTVDAAQGRVTARIDRAGHYVLMAPQF